MTMDTWLRISGIVLSCIGTVLLAWRAKRLIDGIQSVQMIAEMNFRITKDFMEGRKQQFPFTIGSQVFEENFRLTSKLLFLLGVMSLILGNALGAASWYISV